MTEAQRVRRNALARDRRRFERELIARWFDESAVCVVRFEWVSECVMTHSARYGIGEEVPGHRRQFWRRAK